MNNYQEVQPLSKTKRYEVSFAEVSMHSWSFVKNSASFNKGSSVWVMSQLEPPDPISLPTPKNSEKMPFYKKKWFIVSALLVVVVAFSSDFATSETTPKEC